MLKWQKQMLKIQLHTKKHTKHKKQIRLTLFMRKYPIYNKDQQKSDSSRLIEITSKIVTELQIETFTQLVKNLKS